LGGREAELLFGSELGESEVEEGGHEEELPGSEDDEALRLEGVCTGREDRRAREDRGRRECEGGGAMEEDGADVGEVEQMRGKYRESNSFVSEAFSRWLTFWTSVKVVSLHRIEPCDEEPIVI
jgi:hypothetical protein